MHSTTIIVSDQDRALDFFTRTLGWEKRDDQTVCEGMRWLTVAPVGGQTELALGLREWYPGENPPTPGPTGISFSVSDIEATYDTLTAKGVRFKQPVTTMPWGMKATWFYDLDGNEFFMAGV
jgi:catechol 2,3-dioxygenase-like lactoylglutathione lyase family enzyme